MKINELSMLTGISKQTIRYYESIGLLSPKRSTNNYREYSAADLNNLEFIFKLKLLPMSLNDIGLLLELKNQKTSLKCKAETILFIEKYQKIIEERIKVFAKTQKLLGDIKELIYDDSLINQEKQIIAILQHFEKEI